MRHFDGIRPDFYVLAEMARARSNTRKNPSAASVALISIARLLGRQAAREWAERHLEVDFLKPPVPLQEKEI